MHHLGPRNHTNETAAESASSRPRYLTNESFIGGSQTLEDRDDADSAAWKFYLHVSADFGAAGAPATSKRFFVDVLLAIARSE
eukprot:88832-Pleurochrysis_carterae.AAC.2